MTATNPQISIQIQRLLPEDVPAWTEINNLAFGDTPNDILFRLHPYSPETLTQFHTARLQTLSSASHHVFKAISPSNPTHILGIAVWHIPNPPLSTTTAVLADDAIAQAPEFNQAGVNAFFGQLHAARTAHVGGRAHVRLATLVVRPEAQRRGVGGALLRWGLERADEKGWEAYMEASAEGRGLYGRLGFEVVGEYGFELGEWGGEGRSEFACMIRKPVERMEQTEGMEKEDAEGLN